MAAPSFVGGSAVHLGRVGLDADIGEAGAGEGGGEVARPAADVEQGAAGRRDTVLGPPQIGDELDGVVGECAVEPGRIGLFVPELPQ